MGIRKTSAKMVRRSGATCAFAQAHCMDANDRAIPFISIHTYYKL